MTVTKLLVQISVSLKSAGFRAYSSAVPPEEAKSALKMTKKNTFSCTAERKGEGGGTDRAVTPACK